MGLSPLLVEHIYGVIKDINKSKKITVFLVEQNLRLALEVAERGFIIETGHIVRQDAAQALLSSQDIKEAYLGIESLDRNRLRNVFSGSNQSKPDLWNLHRWIVWIGSLRAFLSLRGNEILECCPRILNHDW